jgi:hypothetical protein
MKQITVRIYLHNKNVFCVIGIDHPSNIFITFRTLGKRSLFGLRKNPSGQLIRKTGNWIVVMLGFSNSFQVKIKYASCECKKFRSGRTTEKNDEIKMG